MSEFPLRINGLFQRILVRWFIRRPAFFFSALRPHFNSVNTVPYGCTDPGGAEPFPACCLPRRKDARLLSCPPSLDLSPTTLNELGFAVKSISQGLSLPLSPESPSLFVIETISGHYLNHHRKDFLCMTSSRASSLDVTLRRGVRETSVIFYLTRMLV